MSDYVVIAECVDERTGNRYQRGQKFPNPTPAQEERLTKAGCIRKPTDAEAKLAKAEEEARLDRVAADQAERERKAMETAAPRPSAIASARRRKARSISSTSASPKRGAPVRR
ncbi:hypothetical protein ACFPOB_20555 [Bosea eneae]|uniref:Uncharacterized protein n=1 Tax=Bosea eneae TaxID=151454 RepID=A0ABW0IW52_9HYPH